MVAIKSIDLRTAVLREGADLLFRVYMDHSFSGDETNQDCHYGFLDVLWFRVWDSSDVNIITLNSRKQRKSKICSAEVGRVPRPTRQRKHENRKISWRLTHIVPSPVPQHKKAQIRKPSVCSAEVGRFQRPTRQRNAQKGGQGWRNGKKSSAHIRKCIVDYFSCVHTPKLLPFQNTSQISHFLF
ncbi:MAG: hypothetical protein VB007_07015 [Methanocorpusculum sp.]|uniref:hypothetical protein n=1 Tax=Methanocorpusculum sp. TaxID=2058474 RepID=UPI002B208EDC|nr:hypothetical protein [Methanocorpusculum sp.]MEA5086952.1 hypothetical protein [Methanocorpusculum sp.]